MARIDDDPRDRVKQLIGQARMTDAFLQIREIATKVGDQKAIDAAYAMEGHITNLNELREKALLTDEEYSIEYSRVVISALKLADQIENLGPAGGKLRNSPTESTKKPKASINVGDKNIKLKKSKSSLTSAANSKIKVDKETLKAVEFSFIKTMLHSDVWSSLDFLGYNQYAQVIAQIIKSKDSKPPLTIAVVAPWGHGKTTLMRYIKDELEGKRSALESAIASQAQDETEIEDKTARKREKHLTPNEETYDKLIDNQINSRVKNERELREQIAKQRAEKIEAWLKEYSQGLPPSKRFSTQEMPTIWFNPWQYQSSKQIWAGMAHAIITQLVEKLPKLQQEEFWLKLHLKRIDQNAIRKEIYKTIIIGLIPIILVFIFGFILILTSPLNYLWLSSFLMIGSLGAGIFKWYGEKRKGFVESYNQFFRPPDYESEKGMFHEVNEDLKLVFDLLANDKRVVIFIDDLDRCSPSKIVEVIEAINLMMNGEYHQKCYFVIGMDAQVVAAALDATYKDLHGKLADRERMQGSVGWYFLDKFIQLPFVIPSVKESTKRHYLGKLFHQGQQNISAESISATKNAFTDDIIRQAAKDILAALGSKKDEKIKEIRAQFASIEESKFDQYILSEAFEYNNDSAEILNQVQEFSIFLEDSPRSLKRFANMLRFYSSMQQLRNAKGFPYASTEALGKWLTITLRWPQMVRWIQWSHEDKFQNPRLVEDDKEQEFELSSSTDPAEKATFLDDIFKQFSEISNDADRTNWKVVYQKQWMAFCAKNEHLPWLKDKELFQLLYHYNSPETNLVRALETDVW